MIVPSWADQLIPKLVMEQFDTLPSQCRHIGHMHEGVWFQNIFFSKITVMGTYTIFSLICLLYMHR